MSCYDNLNKEYLGYGRTYWEEKPNQLNIPEGCNSP